MLLLDISVASVVSAVSITLGGFLLRMSRVGDLCGRSRMFLLGVAVYIPASAACGAAGSPGMLMAVRDLKGVGAASG